MKVEFLIENIENLLPTLTKILPTHSQIPVLSNLLLEATKEGFFISATNLEIGVKVKIPAKVDTQGSTTVPGKQFIEALASFPKDKVILSLDKETLLVVCRDSKLKFQTITREEFPNLFEDKGELTYTFKENELKNIFSKLIFAVSIEDSRPELTGILISQKENGIDFVATDGFRLSIKKIKSKKMLEAGQTIILPARLINEAAAIKSDKGVSLYIYKKANQVIFEAEEITLVGRLIGGDFPNYERVVPTSSKTKVEIETEELAQKLRLASVFARDSANIVKVKVENEKLKLLTSSTGLGEGEVSAEVKQEGEDNEIAFNVKFISDIVKNIQSKTLSIELSSPIEPALFKTEEDTDFIHIIMPVRVQE